MECMLGKLCLAECLGGTTKGAVLEKSPDLKVRQLYLAWCWDCMAAEAATYPFVYNDAQRILVASWAWHAWYLIGCPLRDSGIDFLKGLVARTLHDDSKTKTTQQYLVASAYKHIPRLDVPVAQPFLVQ